MRVYIVILVSFLLLLNIVNASRFYTLGSFKDKPDQTYLLQEKDALLFDFKQGRHALVFEKFNSKGGIDLSIFIYQKAYNDNNINQTGVFLSLKPGMYTYIDFDRDLIDDMQIKYLRQIKNNATLQFVALNKSDIDIIHKSFFEFEENPNENGLDSKSNKVIGLSITTIIVLIGLVLLFFFMNKKKK